MSVGFLNANRPRRGTAIFWPVCLQGREREAPSRDLIFITDVEMGEYIRISFFTHFLVGKTPRKLSNSIVL